jgi:hypothetical protein
MPELKLIMCSVSSSGSKTPKSLDPSTDLSTKAKIGIIAGSAGAGVLLLILLCILGRVLLQARKMKSEIDQLKLGGHSDTSTREAPLPPPLEMAMPTPELDSAKLEGSHQVQDPYSPGTDASFLRTQSHSPGTQTYLSTGRPRPVHELQTWSASPHGTTEPSSFWP